MFAPWHVLLLVVILAFWIVPVIVGAQIGRGKGHAALGLVLGLLLGWIGVIIIALVRPAQPPGWQRYPAWPPQQRGWPPEGSPYGQQRWPPQQQGWAQQDPQPGSPYWQAPQQYPQGEQPPSAP